MQEVYVRGEVGVQLDFDFQLSLALGDDNLLYEHSEARVTYRTFLNLLFTYM